jgi:hypothetical protein
MKTYKVIAFCVAQFLRIWVSVAVLVATYVPMSALAYAERGYKAIGGEIILPIILTAVAWVGMGWLTETLYKEYVAEIRLIRAAKANNRKEKADDERKG